MKTRILPSVKEGHAIGCHLTPSSWDRPRLRGWTSVLVKMNQGLERQLATGSFGGTSAALRSIFQATRAEVWRTR